jgi:hypothetical protein
MQEIPKTEIKKISNLTCDRQKYSDDEWAERLESLTID